MNSVSPTANLTVLEKSMEALSQVPQRHVQSLFISDLHLGCRHAQPENFLRFLEGITPRKIYILGDFLDGWKLKASWRWHAVYNKIVKRLLSLNQIGTELYYTPGNHDAFLRCPDVQHLVKSAGIKVIIKDEFIFESRDGLRYLLTHGDKFDLVEMNYQWLSMATSYVYEPLLSFNWWSHRAMRRSQTSPYGLCAVLKDRVKAAVRFISNFERVLFDHAKERGCQGVICGHIHSPRVVRSEGMVYVNIGDWVENCTALIEDFDGSLTLESYFPHVPDQVVSARQRHQPLGYYGVSDLMVSSNAVPCLEEITGVA